MNKHYVAQFMPTLLLGRLGFFYSSVATGIAFTIVALVIGAITFGIGLLVLWPISTLVDPYKVNRFNIGIDLEKRRQQELLGRGAGTETRRRPAFSDRHKENRRATRPPSTSRRRTSSPRGISRNRGASLPACCLP